MSAKITESHPSRYLAFFKTLRYFKRALCLRCPVCGLSPLYPPLYEVNSISAWFATLPRCHHCHYNYQREPGYFLTAAWLLNWLVVFLFGPVSFILLDFLFKLSFWQLLCFNTAFSLGIILLTVRHTKAFFMALDHLLDPLDPDPDASP